MLRNGVVSSRFAGIMLPHSSGVQGLRLYAHYYVCPLEAAGPSGDPSHVQAYLSCGLAYLGVGLVCSHVRRPYHAHLHPTT